MFWADRIAKEIGETKAAKDAAASGTGLGLFVAKQLVEGNGGKIWAESDGPGKGSRFIVELPA